MASLENKVIVISGGSGVIGTSLVYRLLEENIIEIIIILNMFLFVKFLYAKNSPIIENEMKDALDPDKRIPIKINPRQQYRNILLICILYVSR